MNSELGTIAEQPDSEPHSHTYALSIGIIVIGTHAPNAAFYYLSLGLVELITNYQQTSYTLEFSCSEYSCSAQTSYISFKDSQVIYFYLVN